MTDAWKPQPGKPAMTRDEKTLVTDLVRSIRATEYPLYSMARGLSWFEDGTYEVDGDFKHLDLIEPTAAILEAHGIDADGKPVAKAGDIPVAFVFEWSIGDRFTIEHDGFTGTVIGHYRRLDGKCGVVGQQDGTNIVHVYGEKWLKPAPEVAKREGR